MRLPASSVIFPTLLALDTSATLRCGSKNISFAPTCTSAATTPLATIIASAIDNLSLIRFTVSLLWLLLRLRGSGATHLLGRGGGLLRTAGHGLDMLDQLLAGLLLGELNQSFRRHVEGCFL